MKSEPRKQRKSEPENHRGDVCCSCWFRDHKWAKLGMLQRPKPTTSYWTLQRSLLKPIWAGAWIKLCSVVAGVGAEANFRLLLKAKVLANALYWCIVTCPRSVVTRKWYVTREDYVTKCAKGCYVTTWEMNTCPRYCCCGNKYIQHPTWLIWLPLRSPATQHVDYYSQHRGVRVPSARLHPPSQQALHRATQHVSITWTVQIYTRQNLMASGMPMYL